MWYLESGVVFDCIPDLCRLSYFHIMVRQFCRALSTRRTSPLLYVQNSYELVIIGYIIDMFLCTIHILPIHILFLYDHIFQ